MPKGRIADFVLESASDYAIMATDLEGNITFWNSGAENILGWSESEMSARPIATIFTPEDKEAGIPQTEMKNALAKGRGIDERWHVRKDGSRFWASGELLPLKDGDRLEGFVKIVRDRTAQKNADDLNKVLYRELTHRLKNQLAIVQGVVGQSLRNASDLNHARAAISARLAVLGRAHDLLEFDPDRSVAVRDVVARSVNFSDDVAAGSQIKASGPDLKFGAKMVLSLALILHELTTNAMKYGALSKDDGSVDISWDSFELEGETIFELSWREKDGPPVVPPQRTGFGSRLIERGIDGTTARAEITFAPEGVRYILRTPFERTA